MQPHSRARPPITPPIMAPVLLLLPLLTLLIPPLLATEVFVVVAL